MSRLFFGLVVNGGLALFATGPSALLAAEQLSGATHICAAPRPAASLSNEGYGTVHFANTCSAAVQPALQLAIAKLHSFEAEPSDFVSIGRREPTCAIAWWGAAMAARGNPLGGTLDKKQMFIGRYDVGRAEKAAGKASPRERALIDAMDVYYRPYPSTMARGRAYAEKMDAIHAAYPADPDIGALDGLAIIEGVDLNDKTFARQRRAGAVLEQVMRDDPQNPGAPHYLIHAYDYTALAPGAVHAATVEPQISPASSHAQHMPAHIWSMLGEWDKSIEANRRSEYIADPTSAHDPVKGDVVFEHAFDFIAYARLQKGEDRHVAQDLAALRATRGGMPTVVVARYALERGDWHDAAAVPIPSDPFDAVLARFTRAYGAARAGDNVQARSELAELMLLRKPVSDMAGPYWGTFVDIYGKAVDAWIQKNEGNDARALDEMKSAAADDDGHEKHIYLENKLLPMRESLGDMEMALGHPREALAAYQASLTLAPNRYRSFAGAAKANEALGNLDAAHDWWQRLVDLSREGDKSRQGDVEAKAFLAAHG